MSRTLRPPLVSVHLESRLSAVIAATVSRACGGGGGGGGVSAVGLAAHAGRVGPEDMDVQARLLHSLQRDVLAPAPPPADVAPIWSPLARPRSRDEPPPMRVGRCGVPDSWRAACSASHSSRRLATSLAQGAENSLAHLELAWNASHSRKASASPQWWRLLPSARLSRVRPSAARGAVSHRRNRGLAG